MNAILLAVAISCNIGPSSMTEAAIKANQERQLQCICRVLERGDSTEWHSIEMRRLCKGKKK